MTVLTSNHLPQKVDMSAHNPFIEYYIKQTGHGFYNGLPWQKGYGIGGCLVQLRIDLFRF